MESDRNNNLEELLNDLKSQYKSSNTSQESPKTNEVEDLLNNFKSELKRERERTSADEKKMSPDNSSVDNDLDSLKAQYRNTPQQLSEIDRLKLQLKSDRQPTPPSSDNNRGNNDLDSLKAQYQSKQNQPQPDLKDIRSQLKNNRASTANNSQANNDLDSLKAQYQNKQDRQKDRAKSNYDRNKQEIIIREQQKQLKRKQLTRQAEQWLAKLDPLSDEGMWFDGLAESYPSRLEAAISYLSTIEQSNP